jgi:HlyD family secretion protein
VLRDGKPVRVDVVTGLTDGMQTEIVSGDIAEGDKVVVDQQKGA